MTEPGEAFVVGLGEMVVRKVGASILTCVHCAKILYFVSGDIVRVRIK